MMQTRRIVVGKRNFFAIASLLLVLSILSIFAATSVSAQSVGCCCNVQTGEAQPQTFVPPPGEPNGCQLPLTFVEPSLEALTDNLTSICPAVCGGVAALPTIEEQVCASPTPVNNVSVTPVKGQRAFTVSWLTSCEADSYIIERCQGEGCSDFDFITRVSGTHTIRDDLDVEGTELKMNTFYNYRITAFFATLGGEAAGSVKGESLGDLECLFRETADTVCISPVYYDQYEIYLKQHGYSGSPATRDAAFFLGDPQPENFQNAVLETFALRFNTPFTCDAKNRLIPLREQCPSTSVCVPSDPPACIEGSECSLEGAFFGLGVTQEMCEGTAQDPQFCFYDKSDSVVQTCYDCSSALRCYDYKTQGACERNSCELGSCQWKEYVGPSGITAGVCINPAENNCQFCDEKGSLGAPNQEAFSEVFDRCTAQKAQALSTETFPCFFNAQTEEAADCSKATCNSYPTEQACGSPSGGLKLDANNNIINPGSDACNFQVCQWDDRLVIPQCRKNADATPLDQTWPDCNQPVGSQDYLNCEKDVVPPTTSIIPTSVQGRPVLLDFQLFDKPERNALAKPVTDLTKAKLMVCVESASGACTFKRLNTPQLNINDLDLRLGQEELFTLNAGFNTMRFFTEDAAHNKELVKTFSIFACESCDGPLALGVSLVGGNEKDGVFFINTANPTITIQLNEPAQMILAELRQGSTVIPLVAVGQGSGESGFYYNHTFVPSQLLQDGTYTLTFNARDTNGVQMAEPITETIIIDTVAPTITFSLTENEVIKIVPKDITTTLSEIGSIEALLTEQLPVDNVGLEEKTFNITKKFTTTDNKIFKHLNFNRIDGFKILKITATDRAGNTNTATRSFFVDSKGPIITIDSPAFGITDQTKFTLVVKTDGVAECKFWPDTDPLAFSFLEEFDSTNSRQHILNNFEINVLNQDIPLYVECVDEDDRSANTVLKLRRIEGDPEIQGVTATPSTLVQLPLTTVVAVSLDQPGFCKFSFQNQNFEDMAGEFPGFGKRPGLVNIGNVTLPEAKNAEVFVACINALGDGPDSGSIKVKVNLSAKFTLDSTTLPLSATKNVTLAARTNKDAICHVVHDGKKFTLGSGNASREHRKTIDAAGEGSQKFFLDCVTPGGISGKGVERITKEISIIIDTSAPFMSFVADNSTNLNDSQVAFFTDKLRAAWLGNESESSIAQYLYQVKKFNNETVVDCSVPPLPKGCIYAKQKDPDEFFFIQQDEEGNDLNLSDQTDFFVRVAAQNIVGLSGDFRASDGVSIDLSSLPASCKNGIIDADETALDCGGICGPTCRVDQACLINGDCASGVCNPNTLTCKAASCSDGVLNGQETDIDCGGSSCNACALGEGCFETSDCEEGVCSLSGICVEASVCANGVLDEGETDIDCGGSCPAQCGFGRRCLSNNDCRTGVCLDNFCRDCEEGDSDCSGALDDADGDGILDDEDQCLGTPRGEPVNEVGCSASERDSDKDGLSDAWEIRFGLDPFDPSDADLDLDGDGLTNRQEERWGTNPRQADSDGDGWSDYDEVNRGYNPNDPSDHPSSRGFLIFLILLILIALGCGGYFGYQQYQKQGRANVLKTASFGRTGKPSFLGKLFKGIAKPPVQQQVVRPTRPQVQKQAQTVKSKPKAEESWVDLESVAPKTVKTDLFSKLKDLRQTGKEQSKQDINKENTNKEGSSKNNNFEISDEFTTLSSITKNARSSSTTGKTSGDNPLEKLQSLAGKANTSAKESKETDETIEKKLKALGKSSKGSSKATKKATKK